MTITKLGHCCLLVEEKGLRILTDPGFYTVDLQSKAKNLDVILITHEHPDHLHIESVKQILRNNPRLKIITNSAVSEILKHEMIQSERLEQRDNFTIGNVSLEGFGNQHAVIYPTLTRVQNTGYAIADRFFYPGDALTNPGESVEILALPVAGPWIKIAESIDYARQVKPKVCFPVHDGGLKNPGIAHRAPSTVLPSLGVEFKVLNEGKAYQF